MADVYLQPLLIVYIKFWWQLNDIYDLSSAQRRFELNWSQLWIWCDGLSQKYNCKIVTSNGAKEIVFGVFA